MAWDWGSSFSRSASGNERIQLSMSMLDVPPPGAMLPARLSGLPFVGSFLAFRRRDAARPSPRMDLQLQPRSRRNAAPEMAHPRFVRANPLSTPLTLARVGSPPTAVRTATACRPPLARPDSWRRSVASSGCTWRHAASSPFAWRNEAHARASKIPGWGEGVLGGLATGGDDSDRSVRRGYRTER
eukprot:scaffold13674_cov109-Isochrysis_galbana.AAC.1